MNTEQKLDATDLIIHKW